MEFLKKNLDRNFYFQAKINNLFKDQIVKIVDFQIKQTTSRYSFLDLSITVRYTFKNEYGEDYLIIKGNYFDWIKFGFLIISALALVHYEIDLSLIISYSAVFFLLNFSSNNICSELLMKYLILEIEKESKEKYVDEFQNITGNENNHLIKFEK